MAVGKRILGSIAEKSALSRKEKSEMIELKIDEFEAQFQKMADELEKVTVRVTELEELKEKVQNIQTSKISITDLKNYLPTEEEEHDKIVGLFKINIEEYAEKIDESIQNLDQKIMRIRKTFDLSKLERLVKMKADKHDFTIKTDDHDARILAIQKSFLVLATDFTQFLSQMAKINKKLEQLSIINQDIMLGKRNANCISCSKSMEKNPPQKQIRG